MIQSVRRRIPRKKRKFRLTSKEADSMASGTSSLKQYTQRNCLEASSFSYSILFCQKFKKDLALSFACTRRLFCIVSHDVLFLLVNNLNIIKCLAFIF